MTAFIVKSKKVTHVDCNTGYNKLERTRCTSLHGPAQKHPAPPWSHPGWTGPFRSAEMKSNPGGPLNCPTTT